MNPPITYHVNTSFISTPCPANNIEVKFNPFSNGYLENSPDRTTDKLEKTLRLWITTGDQGLLQRMIDSLRIDILGKRRYQYKMAEQSKLAGYVPRIINILLLSGNTLGKTVCEQMLELITTGEVWWHMTNNRQNHYLLATVCLDLAKYWRALERMEKTYVLPRVIERWTGQTLDLQRDTLQATAAALFGEAWPILYEDELGGDLSSEAFIKAMQPPFTFDKPIVAVSPQLLGSLSYVPN